ncbi:HNH endonuclease signature motif containing protein, partial [Arthrobacter sp. SAFR-044]
MEAIGEQFGEAYGGKAYDAGSRLPRPAHLLAVPDSQPPQGEQAQGLQVAVAAATPDGLSQLGGQLAALALAAPDVLASASYVEAAEFAAR